MREVTPVEKLIEEKESGEIGGMVLLILGEPGAGKTMALVKLVMKDMGVDKVGEEFDPSQVRRIPLWTGQKSCQWVVAAAQGLPVTLWMHDSINKYEFYTTGSKKDGIKQQKINLEAKDDLDVKIKDFEEPKEIVDDIDTQRLNVYYIPGADGGEKDKYFFQQKNYELARALNERKYGDHITWNADEIQNIAPDNNKKPFYDLQMNKFPNEWEDFRKNSISKRGTGHGYAEMNWKYYDLKANGIVYMQGGKVHNNHSQINQGSVNNMKRGQFVVNGFEAGEFELPMSPAAVFPWIRDHEDVEMKMTIEADIPDVRPTPEDLESVLQDLPFDASDLRSIWTPEEYAEEADITTRAVQKKLATNKLPGMKVGGSWVMSEEELVNREDTPF